MTYGFCRPGRKSERPGADAGGAGAAGVIFSSILSGGEGTAPGSLRPPLASGVRADKALGSPQFGDLPFVGRPFLGGRKERRGVMKSFRILVAVALLVAASAALAGETGSISGKVVDANGGPLPGVMVKVSGVQLPAGPHVRDRRLPAPTTSSGSPPASTRSKPPSRVSARRAGP